VQLGAVGGEETNVSPAMAQLMGHAVAVIVNGDNPESNTGEGRTPDLGGRFTNSRVAGSIAYCQVAVASNSRSFARLCWAFCARIVCLRGMSNA